MVTRLVNSGLILFFGMQSAFSDDLKQLINIVSEQFSFNSVYVETEITWQNYAENFIKKRVVRFGREGEKFRVDFIDTNPDQQMFPAPPPPPPGLEALFPHLNRGPVARFTETFIGVKGKLQKRLKIEYEGTCFRIPL